MNCEEVEELAGAYALRALPSEELRAAQEHLESCSRHPDIAGLRTVASQLHAAAPEMEPPPRLKARLMETVRREAAQPAQRAPHQPDGLGLRRWLPPIMPRYALAGALAVAIAALIGWNVYLQTADGGQDVTFVRALTDGGVAEGRILYVDEIAVITVENLVPLSDDRTYQIWAISDGTPTGIGLFNTSESGGATTAIEVDLTDVEVVAITVEPAGGSPQPTSDPVLSSQI